MTIKWYPITETRGNEQIKVLPIFEDAESGFSVDVLVFGYVRDTAMAQNIPCFGIGYAKRGGDWYIATVNGIYPDADEPIYSFVPLQWAYLPDEPAEIPDYKEHKPNDSTRIPSTRQDNATIQDWLCIPES